MAGLQFATVYLHSYMNVWLYTFKVCPNRYTPINYDDSLSQPWAHSIMIAEAAGPALIKGIRPEDTIGYWEGFFYFFASNILTKTYFDMLYAMGHSRSYWWQILEWNLIKSHGFYSLTSKTPCGKISRSLKATKLSVNHDNVFKWKHFRVPGHLCGEFTGPRWIPRTKSSDA